MRMIAVLVVVTLAVPGWSQEMPKPGPEHEVLKKMVGTWTTSLKIEGKESTGKATYKMELGGLWLSSSFEGEMFGQKFLGKGLDSYNPAKKKYVGVWVDSMSTTPLIMEGNYDKEKRTLTMLGEGPGMDGKITKFRTVTKMTDADTMEFNMYAGDTKESMFTIIYKRKK